MTLRRQRILDIVAAIAICPANWRWEDAGTRRSAPWVQQLPGFARWDIDKTDDKKEASLRWAAVLEKHATPHIPAGVQLGLLWHKLHQNPYVMWEGAVRKFLCSVDITDLPGGTLWKYGDMTPEAHQRWADILASCQEDNGEIVDVLDGVPANPPDVEGVVREEA